MDILTLLLLLLLGLPALRTLLHRRQITALSPSPRHRRPVVVASPEQRPRLGRPKPPWVRDELIRLKAFMPQASVRTIATTFNELWREKREETVGKTWVAKTIGAHELEIVRKRAEIKKRRPRPMAPNRVWALDLTYVPDIQGKPSPILGLIDHGSRACLALRELQTKSTVAVLRVLLDTIERYGVPRAIRTDNEATFTPFVFGLALPSSASTTSARRQDALGKTEESSASSPPSRLRSVPGTRWRESPRCSRKTWKRCGPCTTISDLTSTSTVSPRPTPGRALGRTPRKQAVFVDEWDGLLAGYWLPP